MTTQGRLIVFEGPDSVGKTTLSRSLSNYLNSRGIENRLLAFPGNMKGTLGNLVYRVHHNPSDFGINRIDPITLQLLHIVSHIDSILTEIIPELIAGRDIILDRYWWSTWVYGKASGISDYIIEKVISFERSFWREYCPAIIFLINRNQPFDNSIDYRLWNNHNRLYAQIGELESKNIRISCIRNDAPLRTIEKAIISSYENLIIRHDNEDVNNLTHHMREPRDIEGQDLYIDDLFNSHCKVTNNFNEKHHSNNRTTMDKLEELEKWMSPAKPSHVFTTYWEFACNRQDIFYKRMKAELPPWTGDKVLSRYRFTNAYRASDRVSQYLIKNVIYNGAQSDREVFFRIILFKLFNRIETWETLRGSLGTISSKNFTFDLYNNIFKREFNNNKIYSGAYIMPSGKSSFGFERKYQNHLMLIKKMMDDNAYNKIRQLNSLEELFHFLRRYATIGDFLAYQFAIDINYSNITNFNEMDFVVPGPGAKSGIRKCFYDMGGMSESDIIRRTCDIQRKAFSTLGLDFKYLFGRNLHLIDCQNLFCEVDKYARIVHPEINGLSNRVRIKQKFQPIQKPIDYFYPPKWGINHLIKVPV